MSEYVVKSIEIKTETQADLKDPKKQKRGFKGLWVPAALLFRDDLCPAEKILAVEIDSLDSDGTGCTASNPYLANFLHIPESSLRKFLYHLRDLNIITVSVHKNYRRTIFSHLDKWCMENPADLRKWIDRKGAPIEQGGATGEHGGATGEQKVSSLSILSSSLDNTGSKEPAKGNDSTQTPLNSNKDILLAGAVDELWRYFKEKYHALLSIDPIMDWFPFLNSVKKHMKSGMTKESLKSMMDHFFKDQSQARLGFPVKNFWGGLSKYKMESEGVTFNEPKKLSQNEIEYHRAMKRLEEKHERERRERIG